MQPPLEYNFTNSIIILVKSMSKVLDLNRRNRQKKKKEKKVVHHLNVDLQQVFTL